MPDIQPQTRDKQAYVPLETPELSDTLWFAWKEKGRARDRLGARRSYLLLVLACAVTALTLWTTQQV